MTTKDFKITALEAGERLDAFLCNQIPSLTRVLVREATGRGNIKVNNFKAKPGQILKAGDVVSGFIEKRASSARPEMGKQLLPPDVIFEDEHLIVVNKPRGLHCVTLLEDDPPTLADALGAYNSCFLTASSDQREAGLVQRLDFFTSGLVLAAKSSDVWKRLHKAFADGEIIKSYLALVEGEFSDEEITIRTGFLSRGERVTTVDESKAIEKGLLIKASVCKREKVFKISNRVYSLVKVTTTGAYRHQVRAHLACSGFSLVGDELYGGKASLQESGIGANDGFLLHAEGMEFNHPTGCKMIKLNCVCGLLEKLK